MNKTEYQAQIFENRLKKKYKELRKWARKNRITCYRLYNKDIPEVPVSVDLYEFLPDEVQNTTDVALFLNKQNEELSKNNLSVEKEIKNRTFIVLYLYERPYEKSEQEENNFIFQIQKAISNIIQIREQNIILKQRKHQKGINQYEKIDSPVNISGLIQEQGQIFKIDLTSYLDTGIFLDHRPLRKEIREIARNKKVLNLFCYTGSFSVYAAQANAKSVESVDLSNTYLSWTEQNLRLNGFTDKNKFIFTKADVISFLKEKSQNPENLYDLIILDPPTFSNSKSTKNVLDINKDYVSLINDCLNLLEKNGILFFSTNSTRLSLKPELIVQKTKNASQIQIEDVTQFSIPKDFENTKCHKCWKITLE